MAADQDPTSRAQRAVALRFALGGLIAGNYMSGNGVCRSLVQVHNPETRGISIHGNTFWRVAKETAISGHSASQVEIGTNYYH